MVFLGSLVLFLMACFFVFIGSVCNWSGLSEPHWLQRLTGIVFIILGAVIIVFLKNEIKLL